MHCLAHFTPLSSAREHEPSTRRSTVEHPDLVAQRITRYANLVGRQNVIAGVDCGFGTSATTTPRVHPEVVMAKFTAPAEGARRASAQLWR